MATRARSSDQRLAFAFGVVFLLIILGMAIFRPRPTPFEYTVFRITLALAAAGVGAVMPGFLHVQLAHWVRAGGALAMFVIVYFAAPAAMTNVVDADPVEFGGNPVPVARLWLEVVDKGKYDDAYEATALAFKTRFDRDSVTSLLTVERSALGDVASRRLVSDQPLVNPPGQTPGAYRGIAFVTKFAKYKRPIYESVWLRSEEDGWKVVGFFTQIRTDAGAFVPYVPEDRVSP